MSERALIAVALTGSSVFAIFGFVALTELDHLLRVWAVRKHARRRMGWLR